MRSEEKARERQRSVDALKRSERQSQHRADQIGALAEVARRITSILDPDELMQAAASVIQSRLASW